MTHNFIVLMLPSKMPLGWELQTREKAEQQINWQITVGNLSEMSQDDYNNYSEETGNIRALKNILIAVENLPKGALQHIEDALTLASDYLADLYASQYIVEREIGDFWENWSMGDDEKTPAVYGSLDDAIDAIKDHIKGQVDAVESGFMSDSEDPADFRIRKGDIIYTYVDGMNYRVI